MANLVNEHTCRHIFISAIWRYDYISIVCNLVTKRPMVKYQINLVTVGDFWILLLILLWSASEIPFFLEHMWPNRPPSTLSSIFIDFEEKKEILASSYRRCNKLSNYTKFIQIENFGNTTFTKSVFPSILFIFCPFCYNWVTHS